MSPTEAPVTRRRPTWPQLPAPVRAAVEARLGGHAVAWTSNDSGYSNGLASVLELAGGDRVFVKAVGGENDFTRWLYREEARRVALLPAGVPMPAFRWWATFEDVPDGPWEVLAFDAAPGRPPRMPWLDDELAAVVRLASRIAEHTVPEGVLPEAADELASGLHWEALAADPPQGLDTYDPWVAANLDRLATVAAGAPDAARGGSLLHGDLRGDNALVHAGAAVTDAVAVDWPGAVRGNVLCDLVGMLPSVRLEGGPEPEDVLAAHPLPRDTDPQAVDAWVALLTGYFVSASLAPPPPGVPHVRQFQRAQAEVCVPWLRRRLREA